MIEAADIIFVVYTMLNGEENRRVFLEHEDAEAYIADTDTDDYEIVEYSRAE